MSFMEVSFDSMRGQSNLGQRCHDKAARYDYVIVDLRHARLLGASSFSKNIGVWRPGNESELSTAAVSKNSVVPAWRPTFRRA